MSFIENMQQQIKRHQEEMNRKDAQIKELTGALEQIYEVCAEEVKTRLAGTPENKVKNFRSLQLLIIPRNMAKAALQKVRGKIG